MNYGLLLASDSIAPALLPDLARSIEAAGFDSLWVPELFGRDPFVMAARLLSLTDKIRVHTGIANVYARDPMAMRAAALTLAELYDDRFSLGLGVSNKVGNVQRGHEWISPVTKLEEFFAGYASAPMMIKPEVTVPLYLAAHGPKLLALAAEHADGVLSYLSTGAYHQQAKATMGAKELVVMQPVALTSDPRRGREMARRALSIYMGLENYHRAWRAQGFSEDDFAGSGSDYFVDSLIAWGDQAQVAERFATHAANGVDRVVIIPLNYDDARAPAIRLLRRLLAAAD